jgi:hypothetical protein
MERTLAALLADDPTWRAVLAAYERAEQALAARLVRSAPLIPPSAVPASDETVPAAEPQTPESPRRRPTGVPRLTSVEGVPDDELSSIHGRLIAAGLLQFDVLSREEGLVYRLTREARLALATCRDEAADACVDGEPFSADAERACIGGDALEDLLPDAA